MEIYETEEQQVEALKRWWKENGQATIVGAVAGIVLILGWNFWQSYQKDKASQASILYEQLLKATGEEKIESVEKIANLIQEKYGSTPYETYSQLLQAKVKVGKGDLEGAKQILEQALTHSSDEMSHVVRLRLIQILMAKGEFEKGLQLIAEVDLGSADGFNGSYDEMKGDLYVALNRTGEARTAYESALRSGHQSPLLQFKLDDLAQAEIIMNNE